MKDPKNLKSPKSPRSVFAPIVISCLNCDLTSPVSTNCAISLRSWNLTSQAELSAKAFRVLIVRGRLAEPCEGNLSPSVAENGACEV